MRTSGPRRCSNSAPRAIGPETRPTRWRRSSRRRRWPASWTPRSCSRRRRSATRRRAGVPGCRAARRSICSRRHWRRSAPTSAELRIGPAGRPGPRARPSGRARAGGDRRAKARSRWPAARGTEPGWQRSWSRSYWSRGTTPLEEILPMLTEARDLAEELGDTEIHTEAMAWRVPTFVALCDSLGPQGGRRPAGDGRADRAAVHNPRRRALRFGDRPLRREPHRSRGERGALPRLGPVADRPRRVRRSTGSRCSASVASRDGWPNWRPR